MSEPKKVIVDTSIWVEFFNLPDSKEKKEVDRLLAEDAVMVTGVIIAEVLQGAGSKRDFDKLKEVITALPYLEATQETWSKVGELSFNLRSKGITVPLTDLFTGALAIENDCWVYSLDAHFKAIPELKLYKGNENL